MAMLYIFFIFCLYPWNETCYSLYENKKWKEWWSAIDTRYFVLNEKNISVNLFSSKEKSQVKDEWFRPTWDSVCGCVSKIKKLCAQNYNDSNDMYLNLTVFLRGYALWKCFVAILLSWDFPIYCQCQRAFNGFISWIHYFLVMTTIILNANDHTKKLFYVIF